MIPICQYPLSILYPLLLFPLSLPPGFYECLSICYFVIVLCPVWLLTSSRLLPSCRSRHLRRTVPPLALVDVRAAGVVSSPALLPT